MPPRAITKKHTNSSIRMRAFNFFFESQCRHTKKYAKALGMNTKNACTPPPAHRIPMSTDKITANANPIKARDCGVFNANDRIIAGSETERINTPRISSM